MGPNEVLRLTKDGVWMSDETEIEHENTLAAFSKSIRRDEQGYFIQISHETKRIIVEDTAYFVTGLEGSVQSGYTLLISDGSREKLDPKTLRYTSQRLICLIKSKQEEAKFLHKAYDEILSQLDQDSTHFFIRIENQKILLEEVKQTL